ncbi:hypothetical protein [Vitiosangium sp. GDMCC 1.1324]|uniref:hypothetical protein n=1 Tax=Vitiosangium sp. (strain GDMCC 1.1324) TaxID=2138576 RepID=UPI000D34DDAF|nr:hypothetical protein [Vitiosangium sp. GDMCC 1.1324]PTL75867.1 hypothetical protein DAT35_52215 [Vitiosangium sp. GDMCC 1.1324]
MSSKVLSSLAMADVRCVLALLGDAGARAELGDAVPPVLPALWHSLEAQRFWKRVLHHVGKGPVLRAMAALARRALPVYQSGTPGASNQGGRFIHGEEGMRLLSETLVAVESWGRCPCRTHREQVLQCKRDWSALEFGHHAAARSVVELVRWMWNVALAPRRFERDAMTGLFSATVALPGADVDALVRVELCEALRAN